MKDKAKLINMAKNCVIVLLFISAVFLLFKAVVNGQESVFESLSNLFSGNSGASTSNLPDSEISGNAAFPVFLLTTTEDGSHYAVKYDSQSKDKLISQFTTYLGEALGSSGNLKEISVEQWQQALSGSGVFFDYLYPQPLSAIASWLGYDITGEVSSKTARRLFLGNDDGNMTLYFISEGDGKIFSCETARDFSSLSPKIADCPIGTANFAFELGVEYANLDPYFIFSHESGTLSAVTVSNPVRDNSFDSSNLLPFFGMNQQTVSEYTETDGSQVYVDGEKTLRVEASGAVIFSVTGNNGLYLSSNSGALSIIDSISSCYEIVKNSIGLTSGDASLGLVGVTSAASPSSCSVNFGYYVDGLPVTLPRGGFAASFDISGGAIIRAELSYRKYVSSGGTLMALPEKQASVIAEAKGGEPVLTYEDKSDSVDCTWIIN